MPWWAWLLLGLPVAGMVFVIAGVVSSWHVAAAPFDKVVADLALVLTATPNLRARFFADPTKAIGQRLPARKYWEYDLQTSPWKFVGRWRELRRTRAGLAQKIVCSIAGDIRCKKLSSAINTDAVFEEFFAPIVRVSQRSFNTVFLLSCGTFLAGLSLIGCGVYVAVTSSETNSTVVASIFGASGTIGALGSVYAMAKQGIREATIDHARLRMVLTAFATQLGQLRALAERPPVPEAKPPEVDDITKINDAIAVSMSGAVGLIPSLLADSAEQQDPKQPRSRRFSKRVFGARRDRKRPGSSPDTQQ